METARNSISIVTHFSLHGTKGGRVYPQTTVLVFMFKYSAVQAWLKEVEHLSNERALWR
jgi:hypothetical protein